MDEKKRYEFIRDVVDSDYYILDTLTGEKINDVSYITSLLNRLCDAAERLRLENKQLNVKYKEVLYQKNFAIEQIKSQENFLELLKQSQKQSVINILNKIMLLCKNGISDYWSCKYILTIIENQIQKLQGE